VSPLLCCWWTDAGRVVDSLMAANKIVG